MVLKLQGSDPNHSKGMRFATDPLISFNLKDDHITEYLDSLAIQKTKEKENENSRRRLRSNES